MSLREHFITVPREYREGTVEVFEQPIPCDQPLEASLSITALGVYEAEINGTKVGDILFAPGFTYYPREVQVQIYDVTEMLAHGGTLRVYLGQGWYCGRFTFDNLTQMYGKAPAVSWTLTVKGKDGTLQTYCSDDATVSSVPSPYEYAGLYDGEIYNENNLCAPLQPIRYEGPLPEHFERAPIHTRIREEMSIQSVHTLGDKTILDFGQNFAGIVTIDPAYLEGNEVILRHGERLNEDGTLYTANLRKAKQEIRYTKGTSTTVYRPRFTYMGFRYVELSGTPYREGLVKAYAIYSDMAATGSFTSDNPLVNRLFLNQLWGQKSNYVEVPTDCPQRDERMGYTGDGHVFARTGMFNFDTERFWEKFLKDIRYSQMDNKEGYVNTTIPAKPFETGIGFLSMLGWGNCVCIVPELLYWQYGTDRYVREQYDSMKRFVDCEIRKSNGLLGPKHLWTAPSLGDWLAPGKDVKYMAMHHGPVSNAFLVNDLRILSWASNLLGKTEDASYYSQQLELTRAAYLKTYVQKTGKMKDDYQGAYVMALQMVIPKEDPLWNKVFEQLLLRIRRDGMQTGFFATAHLLPLLADHGEEKLAVDLLLQENCPGWMYQVKAGATTIWERWDALRPDGTVNESSMNGDNMVSFNHYSFGSVGEFYYRYLLGLNATEPGFQKAQIRPILDARLGQVNGFYRSRAGLFRVCYDEHRLEVEVPVETQLILPNGSTQLLNPGIHTFSLDR